MGVDENHGLDYGTSGWSLKSVAIAVLLTLFLVASSSYIALKLGALPWPIIFSVIAGAGLLRIFGRFSTHELNVAHAGASIGGLMASALVFTIPGLWYLQSQGVEIPGTTIFSLMLLCLAGGLLGIFVSVPIRKQLIEREQLPYPSGTAGAELIKEGFKGGKLIYLALVFGLLAAAFALARDLWFPAGWTLFSVSALGIVFAFYPMPLAVGIGYILGPRASFSWFAGSVVGWLILIPILVSNSIVENAPAFVQNLGMGLLMGAGVGFLLHYAFSRIKEMRLMIGKSTGYAPKIALAAAFSIVILYLVGVPIFASVITVIATLLVVFIAARMTGETNIDPLEQFGIVVGLLALGIYALFRSELGMLQAFLIVAFTSVAAAIAGDIGHDYKAAKLIGTKARDILRVDIITVIVAAIAGPLVLEVIRRGYADVLFTAAMPAPQAQLVAGAIAGFPYPEAFVGGLLFGAAYEILARRSARRWLMMMAFAIGMFLGIPLGLLLFVGGLLALYVKRHGKEEYRKGIVISAGVMGGEGIVGFLAGALVVSGLLATSVILKILLGIVLLALVITLILRRMRS